MITKGQFHSILKEDKFHSDFDEQVKYRYPAVQYFLKNYAGSIGVNGVLFDFKLIDLVEPIDNSNKLLLNQAFNQIKARFDNGEFQ